MQNQELLNAARRAIGRRWTWTVGLTAKDVQAAGDTIPAGLRALVQIDCANGIPGPNFPDGWNDVQNALTGAGFKVYADFVDSQTVVICQL